ncbi:Wzz/FepE/Etk N-terminal domain-containing protein [Actinoplanes sp. NPDC026619]|uniref:Wzz/FepE/Etk N-terminal domain-containing protein n=1 Tax=Actinoplanes sp. NPDC026619 TaxID=3155798 RepID=UPI0033F9E00D
MEASRPADVSHYLGVFRRHWWIALVATGAGLGAGAALTSALPKVYESSAAVLVQAIDQDTNAQGGRTKGSVNLDTEAQLVGSGAVAVKAQALLRSPSSPLELAKSVSVEVPANTTVLVITFKAGSPEEAQAGSHSFAEAYLRNREETAQSSLDQQIKTLTAKIKQLTTTLTGINARLSRAVKGSSDESNLLSLRNNSQNQLNGLTGRLNELTTTTVGAGSIISDARLPEKPTSPNGMVNTTTGGMIGLLIGVALAFVRERFDRRLRSAGDVRDRGRVNVLAALDERTTPHFDDVLQPYGAGGRVFNRLRNEILATLRPSDQVIVVTGTSRGSAATLVAANLAAALARTGSEVVLIGAHLPDSVVDAAPLARMLGVSSMPGLSDLLAGRVGLARALQRTPRIPSLRVITTGGAATAAGLMQSQRLKDTLETLRRQGGYIVIEAPSTSSSADAQSLASLADAALLAVELRKSRRPALLDAAEQLQRVGTQLLGAVVLPRLSGLRAAEASAPAVTLAPSPAGEKNPERGRAAALDAPVSDIELTQPMRFPTNTMSAAEKAARATRAATTEKTAEKPQVRPRSANAADEITAVIDMSGLEGLVKEGTGGAAEDGDKK